ncbi:hypothetical protein A4A49_10632 [Nicotiana attenuata]|uniref:Uncharacterized protein n=1 Tax=Nicotiana attenuata TaxID=49451 RepID=A0A1J6IQG3_NICAT|nr:hypothetical protein A4A49_10632 [Nicotiana attenuata]
MVQKVTLLMENTTTLSHYVSQGLHSNVRMQYAHQLLQVQEIIALELNNQILDMQAATTTQQATEPPPRWNTPPPPNSWSSSPTMEPQHGLPQPQQEEQVVPLLPQFLLEELQCLETPPPPPGTTDIGPFQASILDQVLQNITILEPLTLILPQNSERKLFVSVTPPVMKMGINMKIYPIDPLSYSIVMVPTLREQTAPPENHNYHQLSLALNPIRNHRERSTQTSPLRKILLWNYKGSNGADFWRNLKAVLSWNSPNMVPLTETKMKEAAHEALMLDLGFTNMLLAIQVG